MNWTLILGGVALVLYLFHPHLDRSVLKNVLGMLLFLELFYLIGYYILSWPFPAPIVVIQLLIVIALGMALGTIFSYFWPLTSAKGFERVIRTLLLTIPALGLGIGLQVLLQGNQATQAIYLIFALAAWLGSGRFVRQT